MALAAANPAAKASSAWLAAANGAGGAAAAGRVTGNGASTGADGFGALNAKPPDRAGGSTTDEDAAGGASSIDFGVTNGREKIVERGGNGTLGPVGPAGAAGASPDAASASTATVPCGAWIFGAAGGGTGAAGMDAMTTGAGLEPGIGSRLAGGVAVVSAFANGSKRGAGA